MSKQFLAVLGVAAIAVIALLFGVVEVNQNQVLTLKGQILDVRAVSVTPESTLVIVDFEAANPSNKLFEIEEITLDRMKGEEATPSALLSKSEARNFFEYNKILQPNPQLGIGDKVKGGETVKRMVAARFDLPVGGLMAAAYRIRIRDINDVNADIEGKRPTSGK